MVKLSVKNEKEGTVGLYTELEALKIIIKTIEKSDAIVEINVEYKKRGQAVESSSSIKNPMAKD